MGGGFLLMCGCSATVCTSATFRVSRVGKGLALSRRINIVYRIKILGLYYKYKSKASSDVFDFFLIRNYTTTRLGDESLRAVGQQASYPYQLVPQGQGIH